MITFRQIQRSLQSLGLDTHRPALVHASLPAFEPLAGGVASLLGALRSVLPRLMMPAFTFQTMLIPEDGPADNALVYGAGYAHNQAAQFFQPDLPVDPQLGVIAEAFRLLPGVERSQHPLLSFSGLGVGSALAAQTLEDPLAPIGALAEMGGYVLLMGTDHTANTSIHYGEQLAGRDGFIRWALNPFKTLACPRYPGCSQGFNNLAELLQATRVCVEIGNTAIHAYPLTTLLTTVKDQIRKEPLALLCNDPDCACCNTIRRRGIVEM